MYYWDGVRWVSTLSPDGRHRWNGSAWEPMSGALAAAYMPQRPAMREPTSWTRPLQYIVIGWFVVRGIYQLSIPFWMGPIISQELQTSLQRQQQNYPPGQPPPPGMTEMMTTAMMAGIWSGVIFALALSAVAIAGAIRRWTWAYYAVLALLGIGLLGTVYNAIDLATRGAVSASSPYQLPVWVNIFSYVDSAADGVLFVLMLVVVIRRGPWGMRRISS